VFLNWRSKLDFFIILGTELSSSIKQNFYNSTSTNLFKLNQFSVGLLDVTIIDLPQ